jgi:hypothetical protein
MLRAAAVIGLLRTFTGLPPPCKPCRPVGHAPGRFLFGATVGDGADCRPAQSRCISRLLHGPGGLSDTAPPIVVEW